MDRCGTLLNSNPAGDGKLKWFKCEQKSHWFLAVLCMILLQPLQPLIPVGRHLLRVEDMGYCRKARVVHHAHCCWGQVAQFRIPESKALVSYLTPKMRSFYCGNSTYQDKSHRPWIPVYGPQIGCQLGKDCSLGCSFPKTSWLECDRKITWRGLSCKSSTLFFSFSAVFQSISTSWSLYLIAK